MTQAGIRAFVGSNGAGKTLAMTARAAVPAWERGVIVVSNYRLYPQRFGFPARLWRPLRSWRQIGRLGKHVDFLCGVCKEPVPDEYECHPDAELLEVPVRLDSGELFSLTDNQPCLLLLDEITAAIPARGFSEMPPELGRLLNQFRKPDVLVAWSAPNWNRADKILREVTQYVTVCRGFFPDRWLRDKIGGLKKDANGKKIRNRDGWGANRLFRLSHYDAMAFEEFSLDAAGRTIAPMGVDYYWRPNGQRAQSALGVPGAVFTRRAPVRHYRAYDTRQSVMLMDHLDQVGVCVVCDGSRRRPACTCGPKSRAKAENGKGDAATADRVAALAEAREIRDLRATGTVVGGVIRLPGGGVL